MKNLWLLLLNLDFDKYFRYLESADKPCIVAIDEFQQIGNYEEKNVEALLRGSIVAHQDSAMQVNLIYLCR